VEVVMSATGPRRAKIFLWLPLFLSCSSSLFLGLIPGCSEDCTTPPPDSQPPVVAFTARSSDDGVDLRWTSPANADFRGVVIRFSPDSLPAAPFDGLPVLNTSGGSSFEGEPESLGSLAHTGLEVGTRYYYSAFAYDDGYQISTAMSDSAVATDSIPPLALTAFSAEVLAEALRLQWTAPQDADYYGAMLRYSTSSYPDGPTAGSPVLEQGDGVVPGPAGATMYIDHTGLAPSTTYYYAAFACDSNGNHSPALQDSAGLWHLRPRTSPQNLLYNLHGAYEHRFAAPYESLLAVDFLFLFCENDQSIADHFDRDDEVTAHQDMFSSLEVQSVQLDFALGELTEDVNMPDPKYPDRNLWTLMMTNVDLELRCWDMTYPLEDGIEQFWFREESWTDPHTGLPAWTIVRWQEQNPPEFAGRTPVMPVTWGGIKALYR
jgi:hypothetical protein